MTKHSFHVRIFANLSGFVRTTIRRTYATLILQAGLAPGKTARIKTMNSLAKITERAQRDANRTGRTMLVINLNQYSPLYVIRESNDNTAMTKGVVVIVPPVQS